MLIYKKHFLL